MPLPKIDHTIYNVYLTGIDRKVKYRPFTNSEQKALLNAKSEQDSDMIYDNVKNVVQQCIVDDVSVDDLTIYDFEEIFMRIRSKSVDQFLTFEMKTTYFDENGEKQRHTSQHTIDCDDIKIQMPEKEVSRDIEVSEKYTLRLKKPTIGSATQNLNDETNFIIKHMECLFSSDGEEVYYLADEDEKEVLDLYDSLETPVMQKIEEFFAYQPKLYYKLEIELPNGKTEAYEFKSLEDFFT